jgi:CBS domain-containing protein
MRLQEIMRTDVESIEPKERADAAWQRMWRRRIRHLVVTENGQLIGMITERDLGGRNGEQTRAGRTVGELMSPRVVRATPKTTLRQAANLMRGREIGSLPVLDGKRLVGIVTATDVLDELGRGFARPDVGTRRRRQRAAPPSRHKSRSVNVGAAARRRGGVSDGRRAPLPGWLPRPAKRHAGNEGEVPAYIRSSGVSLTLEERQYIRRKLGMKLSKFAQSIERVSVRVDDVNGPRGGADISCRIKIVIGGLPSINVERVADGAGHAFDRAIADAQRALRKALQRRRTRPMRLVA